MRQNPQPSLGQRYHLCPHPQRLAVSGGGAGLAFTQNRRLGHGLRDARSAGARGLANGTCAAQSWCGPYRAFRLGNAVASGAHQALLTKHGLVGSMSQKGNCWDNSVMERFFLNLKIERVWQKGYANHGEAIHDVADYIVGFYNSVRLHSRLA